MAQDTAPSTLAIAFATSIIAGLGGYFLGQASSIGIFGKASPPAEKEAIDESDVSEDEDDEESDEEQDLKNFDDSNEECKLVLVVRTDLGMTKGTPKDATS